MLSLAVNKRPCCIIINFMPLRMFIRSLIRIFAFGLDTRARCEYTSFMHENKFYATSDVYSLAYSYLCGNPRRYFHLL